jgi:hypothetical protein
MVLNLMATPLSELPVPAKSRTLISENSGSIFPFAPGYISPLPELKLPRSPQEIGDRKREMRPIIKRLSAMIEEHRASALRMDSILDAEMLDRVLHALEAEARDEDPAAILADPNVIRAYLLESLYEDLLAEPSNILFTTKVSEDVVRYEAMDAAFWQECVAALRQKLIQ